MSKKHYEAIAEAFAESRPLKGPDTEKVWQQWALDVEKVGRVLKYDNPRFQMSTFVAACNYRKEVNE